MISPPKRQGIDPHGSLLEPLWNLFRETILFPRWPSERKRQVFSELRGGRTRTRTLDPLIKSNRVPLAAIARSAGRQFTFRCAATNHDRRMNKQQSRIW